MSPERTVPASSIPKFFWTAFGWAIGIIVLVGIGIWPTKPTQPTKLTPSNKASTHTITFPTNLFQLVRNYDRSIAECVEKIGVLEKRGIKTGEDIGGYYKLLNTLQTLKADRARYAADYNNRAADIFKIYKEVTPDNFKKAGFPLGIQ